MFGILIFFGAVLGVSSDTSTCDPATQYQDGDNCCQMCGPGTKMSRIPVCEDPQCAPCPENEYQDAYNRDKECQRQPYCDPNKYFDKRNNNKTSRVKCRCKSGYHCNSKDCLFCVPHTKCEPGSGVVSRGTDREDTQCQVCPPNTFSNDTSAGSECLKHTICGGNTETEGTNESDTVCAVSSVSPGVIAVIIVAVVLAVVVLSGFLFWKHASGTTKGKVKKFFGLCGWTSAFVPMQKDNPRNMEAEEFINVTPEEPGRPETESSALETGAVEDEEVGQPGETEQGNQVAQEDGRIQIITHPVSQMNSMVSFN